jgi:hypothetical protein
MVTSHGVDVEVLRWPADGDRLAEVRARGVPRLLVVEQGEPPAPPDCLEDWVPAVAGETERELRLRALRGRARRHGGPPALDADGLLHHRDAWVALSPVERALAAALLERFGAVVHRHALAGRAWPGGLPTRNALDVHMLRLRRRIAPVGLEIRTVRSRGYLMQVAAPDGERGAGRPGRGAAG